MHVERVLLPDCNNDKLTKPKSLIALKFFNRKFISNQMNILDKIGKTLLYIYIYIYSAPD